MCRWFTYLGEEPLLLEDTLLRPAHSLVKQTGHVAFEPASHASSSVASIHSLSSPTADHSVQPARASDKGSPNPLSNMDGFGVSWYSTAYEEYENGQNGGAAARPVTYKNIRPPLNDLVLQSLARGVATSAVLAHIRAGTGLTPVVETNCHPYTFGRHLFAHNGVLGSFHLFRAQLLSLLPLRYQLAILGTTDSEHIAALYFFHLCGESGDWNVLHTVEEMASAMRATVSQLETLKAAAEKTAGIPPDKIEHNALNLVVTSGASLVAIRYASPPKREPPSLYFSTSAGSALNRKYKGHPDLGNPRVGEVQEGSKDRGEHGRHVIVASEPSTYDADEWDLVGKGEMIIVGEDLKPRRSQL